MTTRHILKPLKYLFYAAILALIIVAFNGALCSASAGNLKADIELTSEMIISNTEKEIKDFGERKNYYDVPEGYKVAAIGEFHTSVFTVKCSYELLIKDAISMCKNKKYHGFGLVDLEKPNIINSCYRSKVIFFVAID